MNLACIKQQNKGVGKSMLSLVYVKCEQIFYCYHSSSMMTLIRSTRSSIMSGVWAMSTMEKAPDLWRYYFIKEVLWGDHKWYLI
jgi:hypothetical protein